MTSASRSVVSQLVSAMASPSDVWLTQARTRLDELTKPLGSLGRLEDIAAQLVSIQQERSGQPLQKAVYIFAADHGITREGVSAYPSEVTRQMVLNFLSQGAAISVLAKLHHVEMNIVDVGVDAIFEQTEGLIARKIRRGSRNMLHEAALSDEELAQAIATGANLASEAKTQGKTLLAVGEMGIGNTTAASAITSLLTCAPVTAVTGRGTGLDAAAVTHKRQIIEAVLQRHFPEGGTNSRPDPLEVLRCVGGLEIAAMTGFILGSASNGIAVVVDGFISASAAAIAFAIEPRVRAYLFAGHQSEEPGHGVLLEYLGIRPILSLGMRLGEGTGAVLAMPIIESAQCLYNEMATFKSASVSEAKR
jgi:nicotinate-nucleotide--dimethylbenzimidazole phosphoribosyltransferase